MDTNNDHFTLLALRVCRVTTPVLTKTLVSHCCSPNSAVSALAIFSHTHYFFNGLQASSLPDCLVETKPRHSMNSFSRAPLVEPIPYRTLVEFVCSKLRVNPISDKSDILMYGYQ